MRFAVPVLLLATLAAACDLTDPRLPEVAEIRLSDSALQLEEGDTVRLAATVVDASGGEIETLPAGLAVTWRSEDSTVVRVQDGLLTGLRGGTTRVVATVGEYTASAEVTVRGAATLKLTAPGTHLDAGQTLRLTVTAANGRGEPRENPSLVWTSSDERVATVADGVVTGRAPGAVVIRASSGAAADSVALEVEPAVAELVVGPDTLHLILGRTAQLFVEARDAAGRPMSHSLTLVMTSPAVATIDAAREVRALSLGSAELRVTAGAKVVVVPIHVVSGDRYSLTPLPNLDGAPAAGPIITDPLDINNRGEIVGWHRTDTGSWGRSFLWRNGKATLLDASEEASKATGINDAGTIVGWSTPSIGLLGVLARSWIWREGVRTPLAVTGADAQGRHVRATAINERGQVLGYSEEDWYRNTSTTAFVWEDGQVTWLKPPQRPDIANTGSRPVAFNNQGAVLVNSRRGHGESIHLPYNVPFLWENGSFRQLPGPAPADTASFATGLNDRGQILVNRLSHQGLSWAYFTSPATPGAAWVLEGSSFTTYPSSRLVAINGYGDLLRSEVGSMGVYRGSRLVDLDAALAASGYRLEELTAMNDLGQVVGIARSSATGKLEGVLLTPAP